MLFIAMAQNHNIPEKELMKGMEVKRETRKRVRIGNLFALGGGANVRLHVVYLHYLGEFILDSLEMCIVPSSIFFPFPEKKNNRPELRQAQPKV